MKGLSLFLSPVILLFFAAYAGAWGAGMVNSEAGAIQIENDKGLYLMVSIDTRNAGNVQSALPLMENMLNYAIKYASESMAVNSSDKLATTWASIKMQ